MLVVETNEEKESWAVSLGLESKVTTLNKHNIKLSLYPIPLQNVSLISLFASQIFIIPRATPVQKRTTHSPPTLAEA